MGSSFTIKDKDKYEIKMLGNHQIENAINAIAVLSYLKEKDFQITDASIKRGIKTVQIPARCQIISKNPLIIVDGAHNPESAQALYKVINDIIKKKAIIIFGASQGKLVNKIFTILAPIAEKIILTQSENPRHIPASQLAEILTQHKIPFITTNSVKTAIKQGLKLANRKTPLVSTGSFYVASETLKILKPV
jgi:dihydrofolate synthase/folylpolyglutamate synthase